MAALKLNDKVKLKAKNEGYFPAADNPVEGTEHECYGYISRIQSNIIYVDWSNGRKNIYSKTDLRLAEQKYKSVW